MVTGAPVTLAPRTRLLLEAPVLPMLLKLSAPNLAEAAARVTFLTADAVFVSWLGSDALAAVAIVFPLLLMFQASTTSGFGAGVSSAIGQALGAGQRGTAGRLAGCAVALSLAASIATMAFFLLFGPALYQAMGATGATLDFTVRYGAAIFGGIGLVWLMNTLANIARGSGNMFVPASSVFVGEACHLVLSPALILGWGPFPQLGIVGAAVGALSAYAVGTIIVGAYLCSRLALVRVELRRIKITAAETRAILKIGAPTAAGVVIFWATTFFTTAVVGQLGTAAIAAYGIATRLDMIQYPIIFAFGSAMVTMVATAVGAGDRPRVARVALTGCGVATGIAVVFTVLAIFGETWMGLFTDELTIRTSGALYLIYQAPTYPLIGAGIAAAFACTASGNVRLPVVVNLVRLIIAVGGGWLALTTIGEERAVFVAVACAGAAYGLGMLLILRKQLTNSEVRK